jgi:hypothetical protein
MESKKKCLEILDQYLKIDGKKIGKKGRRLLEELKSEIGKSKDDSGALKWAKKIVEILFAIGIKTFVDEHWKRH